MKKVLFTILVVCVTILSTLPAIAGETSVPHFLNYQSLLYDDGGNLIPDGQANIIFRIVDANGNVLFDEYQTVNVVDGYVSAIVGNGVDANNAPIGGIPEGVLSPEESRYLEVTVDNYPPEGLMEIVSVPYSIYAEKAFTVADGSIDEKAIKNGSIKMTHLTDDLVEQLASEMETAGMVATPTDITNLQTGYSSSAGATNIGVGSGFTYSSGENVEAVVRDLDQAILDRQTNIATHANTPIASAHPNGTIPINRLDTDVATQSELDTRIQNHTHTGGADGPKLNGIAFWVDAGGVDDDSYVSVASGFDVNSCKMVIGVYNAGVRTITGENMSFCARYCRDSSGNRFRVRCRIRSGTGLSKECSTYFGDNNVEGSSCDIVGSYPGDPCRVSYMAFCPK